MDHKVYIRSYLVSFLSSSSSSPSIILVLIDTSPAFVHVQVDIDSIIGSDWEFVLGLLQFLLLGSFLGENECPCSSLVDPEPDPIDNCELSGCHIECSIDTVTISELNEPENIIPIFVGIFPSSFDSGIDDNSTFVSNFKELFEILQIDIVDRMDPHCPFQSSWL